jgi:tetratricopeptide (TPR) repeat protein/tRNA A-37 threonylcarbamoyl transferase component Bud32
MSSARWTQAKAIFEAALDLAPAERDAYVAETCGPDAELRADVEALLVADDSSSDFLEPPLRRSAADLVDGGLADAGRRVGNYRLIELIASGGMGRVYRAVRSDDQYEQVVAVKLLKRGMDTDELLRRFRQERQTLASLDHAHIARLLDGGSTDDGLPYVVLEYVAGRSIDHYCDEHSLGIRERLRLFCDVCSAVQCAHRSLVVHRDLKPSNILVTEAGVPKLLDFGLAKLLNAAEEDRSDLTTVSTLRIMTLRYASPEQVRGALITTASDVYSLGVILYELLTGVSPYPAVGEGRAALERSICEDQPRLPSAVATQAPRSLRGDLDAIVLTALAKEPQNRYASVDQLAEDLRRHLEGLPIEARKPTFAYHAGKFVRRNRVATAAVAAAAVSLVVGTVGLSVGLWRAWGALALAESQKRAAQLEARRAEEVSGILQDLYLSPSPGASGQDVTVREVLDSAAARLEHELTDAPGVRARLHGALADTYLALSQDEQAVQQAELAVALCRSVHGATSVEYALAVNRLARCLGVNYYGEPRKRAAELHHEALGVLQARPEDTRNLQARVWCDLGGTLANGHRPDLAEEAFRKGLEMCRAHDVTPRTSHLTRFARVLILGGDPQSEAEALLEQALQQAREEHGAQSYAVAMILQPQADLMAEKGDYERAEHLLDEALGIRRRLAGDEHLGTANALMKHADVLFMMGRLQDAKAARQAALEIHRTLLGPDHDMVGADWRRIGLIDAYLGDRAASDAAFAQTWSAFPEVSYWVIHLVQGHAREVLGDVDGAEQSYQWVLNAQSSDGKYAPSRRAALLTALSRIAYRRGEYVQAESLAREALDSLPIDDPPTSRSTRQAQYALGQALLDQGRLDEAEPVLRACWADYKRSHASIHPYQQRLPLPEHQRRAAQAAITLGRCVAEQGRVAEAEPLLRRGCDMLTELRGAEDAETLAGCAQLAALHEELRTADEAGASTDRGATVTSVPE